MANKYMRASKLGADQFLEVLHCYCNLDGPLTAERVTGVKTQSITPIYLKISNRLRSLIPIPVWTMFYEDVREAGFGELAEDGSLRLKDYAHLFRNLGDASKEYFDWRKRQVPTRFVDKTDMWKMIVNMNKRWKGIPEAHFDTHMSIVLYRGLIKAQIEWLYQLAVDEKREAGFWEQQSKDWPEIQHNNNVRTFYDYGNITCFVEKDLIKQLFGKPLNAADGKRGKIVVHVYSDPEFIHQFVEEQLANGNQVPVILRLDDTEF